MKNDLIHAMTESFEGHDITDHFVGVNKMVERRLATAEKKALKNPDGLEE